MDENVNSGATNTATAKPLPVSFVVIARPDDAGWMPEMLKSLPPGGEVVILWNEPGESEGYQHEGTKTLPNGTTVVYHRWTYTGMFSFSEARNLAISSATRDWIMWLDTDDRLLPHQHSFFSNLDAYGPGVGGLMCGVCGINPPNAGTSKAIPYNVEQVRLFRNHLGIGFEGRAHEQCTHAIEDRHLRIIPCSLLVHHVGYEVDDDILEAKMWRNVRLLSQQLAHGEYRNDDFTAKMLYRDLQNLLALKQTNME